MADHTQLGELLTLGLLALAMGMDAFSISLGLGMRRVRLRKLTEISLLIGLFHMLMPMLGIVMGKYLSEFIGDLAIYIGGSILILFGVHMIFSSFFAEKWPAWTGTTGLGLLLFSLGVSMDSFSVGLSLGLFAVNTLLAILLFGLSGLIMTATGLFIGGKIGYRMGDYGEAVGGMILVAFGIKFLL